MPHANTNPNGIRRDGAPDPGHDQEEPLDAYLIERPALMLTFLEMAEQYWQDAHRTRN